MEFDDSIFRNGKISKILFKFAVPSVISLLVAELYCLVDTVFVGRYVGSNAIAALTIAFPVQTVFVSLSLFIGVGVSTVVAKSLGEKNYDVLKKAIINSISFILVIVTVVSLIILLLKKQIIYGLGASDIVYPLANQYLSIVLIGGIFQCLGIVVAYIMTALGNTKITLYSNLIGAIANTIIDYMFVVIFKMGVPGAAIATVISQIISCSFIFYEFGEIKATFKIKVRFSLNASLLWTILAIGFSTFVVEISDALNGVLLNNLLYIKGGDNAIIILGVVTKLSMFMYITIMGITSAMQPIISYNYGAGNYKRMKETLKISIIMTLCASIVFWLIFMIFANSIIGFFLIDKDILPKAVSAFRICIAFFPGVSIYYITIYYYQAIEEAKKSFLLSIYRQLIVFIPIMLLLITILGVNGVWISYAITDIIAFVTSIYFIRKAEEAIGKRSLGVLRANGVGI